MILGPMIAAAMAGALALPAVGTATAGGRGVDTPPAPPPAAASTNPLLSLVGAGFAAIGDAMHAVPILGPLAADVGEGAFCAAEFVPVVGDVAKASVNKFDKDQKQGNGCASGSSSGSSTGSSTGSSSTGSAAGSAAGKSSSTGSSAGKSSQGGSLSLNVGLSGTSGSGHASATDHTSAADHSGASDHAAKSDHPGASAHGSASTSSGSSAAKHAAQTASFPSGRFQLRQGTGGNESCLVKGSSSAAIPGPCDPASAWIYQSSTGELHPATDSAECLVAPSTNLDMVAVSSCSSATSWAKHWYLSGTHRLFVRDTSEHGSWRFLGAPGALVVGGVDQRDVPAVPVWSLPAA